MKKQQLVVSFPSYKLGTYHAPAEPGRNEPCPCKSGKKYKHCCMNKFHAQITAKVVDASKRSAEYTPPAWKAAPAVFTYPATPNKITITPAPADAPAPEKKVLIVDDSDGIAGLFRKGLTLIRKGGAK